MDDLQIDLAEVDLAEMIKLLRESKTAFLEFMIPEILGENPVEDFHLLFFLRAVDLDFPRDVTALPRDHAKTTYLRLAFVYLILFSPLQFFVYMGPTSTAAAASLQVIWSYLQDENVLALFGGPERVLIQRESEGHFQFIIKWYDEDGIGREKLVILKALGAQQQLRGMNVWNLRPQFVGCDDIETEEDVRTETGYLKFKSWFDNVFMRAVSREKGRNKVCQIGNLVGMKTLLADNLSDPDWRAMRFGIIRNDGTPLWRARFSLEDIRKDFVAARRRRQLDGWFGELMNAPINATNALIKYDEISVSPKRMPDDGNEYKTFITIDPAGDGKNSDDFAIVLHTIDDWGVPQITEYVAEQSMTPHRAAEVILEFCMRWNCWVVGCEAVRLQKVFLSFFELYFAHNNVNGVQFVPVHIGKKHKTDRLRTFCSALATNEYTVASDDWTFVQQLVTFDTTIDNNRDDLIDAGSQGIYMLENYRHEINAARAAVLAPATPLQKMPGSSFI